MVILIPDYQVQILIDETNSFSSHRVFLRMQKHPKDERYAHNATTKC